MKIPDIKLIFVMILGAFLLSACDNRYRYPCQNPDNWEKDYCQKPICEVSRDCPEYIFKGQESLVSNTPTNNAAPCKER